MNDYRQLSAHFAVVRRSWKRTAALSGMAILISEGIGILTVLLLLDWLFKPLPFVRVALWALALAGIAYFFVRHVLAPLMRKIPDEQIALYIEEHRSELDGMLITAAEYAGKGEQEPGQAALIDAVMKEASARSTWKVISRVVDLSRLKKYGVGAIAGIAVYVLASLLFPNAIAHHIGRVLWSPWKITVEDTAPHAGGFFQGPIRFTLSKGDVNLERGASFDLEATLSRTADKPVLLNFRTANGGGEWQQLPFTEIEKVNGFKGTLADVSEDLEFYVSCGKDKSPTHRITVYDPLVVQSIDVTTHYPAYTKLPDRIESKSSGDVEALVDSKVTVRITANVPLRDGQFKWGDGRTQKLEIDPVTKTAASATFDVKADGSYDYSIADVNGQKATSAASLTVHAIPDNPPTIEVKAPKTVVMTHPLGEVNFDVAATDDFGVASVDLVYMRVGNDGTSAEVRVPVKMESDNSNDPADCTAMHGKTRLMLEDFKPSANPDDAISYYLEAHDTKGQKAVSEMGLITIGYFETWTTWGFEPEHNGTHKSEGPDLQAMLKAVWLLDSQKPSLAPADFQKQSKDMAALMTDETGAVRNFVDLHHFPQLVRVADKIALHAGKAHEALTTANTDVATSELRIAAALYAGGILSENKRLTKYDTKNEKPSTLATAEPPTATMLELARLDAVKTNADEKARTEKEKAESKEALDTSKAIEELLKQQTALVAKAKNQAEAQPNGEEPAAAKQPAALAPEQRTIGDKTKAVANAAKANPAAAEGSKLQQAAEITANASQTMAEAARDFEDGKNSEALGRASKAKNQLDEALAALVETDRDKLEAAITRLESRVAALLDNQRETRGVTESLAKELEGNKTADQRQKRDAQSLSFKQAGYRGEAESLASEINDLNKWAAQIGKAEAVHSLNEAQLTIKRSQPEVKMANAIVELNNTSPATAAEEQKKAEAALEKILSDLHASSDALAMSRDEKVKAAARAAAEAKAAANTLAGKANADQPAAGNAQQPAAGNAQQQAAGNAKQPAAGNTQQPAAGKADQPAQAKPTEAEQKAAAQKLAFQMANLVAELNQREIVAQDDLEKLKKEMTMDKAELEKRLRVDPDLLARVSGVIDHISAKLETELEAKTEAKKLFSSQREECPPGYRQFVNKYFEALSHVARPAEPEVKH